MGISLLGISSGLQAKKEKGMEKRSILIVGSLYREGSPPTFIDPVYKEKLNALGYEIGMCPYRFLTREKLKKFNVVVLIQQPRYPLPRDRASREWEGFKFFGRALPLLHQFLKEGGGILVFNDGRYNFRHAETLNTFLKPLGAELLSELVYEKDKSKIFNLDHEYYAYSTQNITPHHPLTRGVKSLLYPLYSTSNLPLKVDSNWEIIVRLEKSVYAEAKPLEGALPVKKPEIVYEKEPPVVAARDFGKGRIVVFSTNSTYWILNGYHPKWGGKCFEVGDGLEFFENIFSWLSEPSLKSKVLGGFEEKDQKEIFDPGLFLEMRNPFKSIPGRKQKPSGKIIKGIIGVKPKDIAPDTINAFAKEAKNEGYGFIIFTPDNPKEKDWERLNKICKEISSEDFVALAGVEAEGDYGNKTIFFNLADWKMPEKNFKHFQLLKQLARAFTVYVTSHLNNWPPYSIGALSGIEVFGYDEEGNLTSEATSLYKKLQRYDWFLVPWSIHRIKTPEEITHLKGYKTYFLASSPGNLLSRLDHRNIFSSFVSEGPLIEEFWMEGEGMIEDYWEGLYYMWPHQRDRAKIHIKVSSKNLLKEVILWEDGKIFRHFYPNSFNFYIIVEKSCDNTARNYLLEVKDEKGKKALSSPLRTRAKLYWSHGGADRMNTYSSLFTEDENGLTLLQGKRYTSMGGANFGLGWGNWVSIAFPPVPFEDLAPLGVETGGPRGGLFPYQRLFPVFSTLKGKIPRDPLPERYGYELAGGDCAILRERIEDTAKVKEIEGWKAQPRVKIPSPSPYLSINTLYYVFRWRKYGALGVLIEEKIRIKRVIRLKKEKGFEIEVIRVPFKKWSKNTLSGYSYINLGGGPVKKEINFLSSGKTLDKVTIGKKGYLSIFPDPWGNLGIYILDKNIYQAELGVDGFSRPYISLGWERGEEFIPAGTEFEIKLLLLYSSGKEENPPRFFFKFWKDYGLKNPPSYSLELEKGEIKEKTYPLRLKAEEGYLKGKIEGVKNLINPLPLVVEGLTQGWDAFLLELKNPENLRKVSLWNGKGWLVFDSDFKEGFFLGHPVVSDNLNLRINILFLSPGRVEFILYNPLKQRVEAKIFSSPGLKGFIPEFEKGVTLSPGEERKMIMEK